MPRKLTEEEINSLQYFWEEKGDLERLSGFDDLKPLLKEQAPLFYQAWENYKDSIRIMRRACEFLPREVNFED